jgi:hypothetical protein
MSLVVVASAVVQAVGAAIAAGATVVLVRITRAYARESKRMADEMVAGRKAATTPRLALRMRRPRAGDSGSPLPFLQNIGPGDALDISVDLSYEPDLFSWSKRWHLLRPGEEVNVTPFGSDFANRNIGHFPSGAVLRMVASCADPHGPERLRFEMALPVKETVELSTATAQELEGPRQ